MAKMTVEFRTVVPLVVQNFYSNSSPIQDRQNHIFQLKTARSRLHENEVSQTYFTRDSPYSICQAQHE